MKKTVDQLLIESAKVFEEKGKEYGHSYLTHGRIMAELFPEGIKLSTTLDHNRFGVLTQIISKISRYANNFDKGGHDDSLKDIGVYVNILRSIENND